MVINGTILSGQLKEATIDSSRLVTVLLFLSHLGIEYNNWDERNQKIVLL